MAINSPMAEMSKLKRMMSKLKGKKNEETQEEDSLLQGIVSGDSRNIMLHLLVLGIRRANAEKSTVDAHARAFQAVERCIKRFERRTVRGVEEECKR